MMAQPTPPAPAGTPGPKRGLRERLKKAWNALLDSEAPAHDHKDEGEHHGHEQKFCPYRPGQMPWDYIKEHHSGKVVVLWLLALIAGSTAAFVPAVAPWATALFGATLAWVLVEFGARTFIVPKNCYALRSSGEVIDKATYGPGFHPKQIGDEIIVIRTNPITVSWAVKGVKLEDNFTVDVEGQVTVTPDSRIAGEDGRNMFGKWIIEGRAEGDDSRGVHNVEHGIQGGITSLVTTVLTETSSEVFEKAGQGLDLLLEAELSCHEPPHHNQRFCDEVGGGPDNGTGSILTWYDAHHRKVKEWLEHHAHDFAVDPTQEIDPKSISHHERHVGSVHDHTIVTRRAYTADSLKLVQAKKAAEKKGEGVVVEALATREATEIKAEGEGRARRTMGQAEADAKKSIGAAQVEVARSLAAVARDHAKALIDAGADPNVAATAAQGLIERAGGTTAVVTTGGGNAQAGATLVAGMNAVNNPPQAGGGAP